MEYVLGMITGIVTGWVLVTLSLTVWAHNKYNVPFVTAFRTFFRPWFLR